MDLRTPGNDLVSEVFSNAYNTPSLMPSMNQQILLCVCLAGFSPWSINYEKDTNKLSSLANEDPRIPKPMDWAAIAE